MPASGVRQTAYVSRRGLALLTALVVLCGLPACAKKQPGGDDPFKTGHEINITPVRPQLFASWTEQQPAYRIGPGDRIKAKFLITMEMDDDVTVAPDGSIGLRATGQINADGMTLRQLEQTIRRLSRGELVDQRVAVSLVESASQRIYVGGQVKNAGSFELTDMRVSVLQALLMAGGVSDDARLGEAAIIRRGPDNRPMLRVVNLRQIIESGTTDGDVPLVAGDIIYVPRSTIGEVDLWVEQFINKVVPFQRSFSYTLGAYTVTNLGAGGRGGGGAVP